MSDAILIGGAGPAGVVAALRAADPGAETALITREEFGGMAANDRPVSVCKRVHAVRLIREARQLAHYGIAVTEPVLDYLRLLARESDWSADRLECQCQTTASCRSYHTTSGEASLNNAP